MVAPAAIKEVHFFDNHFQKGIDWYSQRFRVTGAEKERGVITGEASPYYLFHPLAAHRIAETLPEVKLIVLLRNPVNRAFSHYHHEVRRGHETLPFADALAAEDDRLRGEADLVRQNPHYRSLAHQRYSYRVRGCYMEQLDEWLKRFRRDNMLIIQSERFYAAPADTLRRVCEFLGVPPFPGQSSDFPVYNLASYPSMDPEIREGLLEFYKPHNQRLEEFLGERLSWDG